MHRTEFIVVWNHKTPHHDGSSKCEPGFQHLIVRKRGSTRVLTITWQRCTKFYLDTEEVCVKNVQPSQGRDRTQVKRSIHFLTLDDWGEVASCSYSPVDHIKLDWSVLDFVRDANHQAFWAAGTVSGFDGHITVSQKEWIWSIQTSISIITCITGCASATFYSPYTKTPHLWAYITCCCSGE